MLRLLFRLGLVVSVAVAACFAQVLRAEPLDSSSSAELKSDSAFHATETKKKVLVIPVRQGIDEPVLFVLRRGLKEAIDTKVDFVLVEMDTKGGRIDVMLEMMKALDRFEGATGTFIDEEAGSAGALIAAVTDDIYFAPKAVMGASEPVLGDGQDLSEGMKRKVTSYLGAKIEAYSGTDPRRADVIKSMMDPNFELKLDEKVIKAKGEVLTLNVKKAQATYGTPPVPLLSIGVAKDIDDMLTQKFGAGKFSVKKLEVTWSEQLAQYLNAVKPILLGLGLLAVFIELKTPGFGVFGITGGVLLGIVFLSSYVAGLSGHEPLIFFAVGVLLVALEIFLFPGVVVVALAGVVLVLGSLVWAMADVWPNEPVSLSGDMFVGPSINLLSGMLIAVVLALLFARFIPSGWFFSRLAVSEAAGGSAQLAGISPELGAKVSELLGARGVAVTGLFPSGQIELGGRRYEARVEVGSVAAGSAVVVTKVTDFGLMVEAVS